MVPTDCISASVSGDTREPRTRAWASSSSPPSLPFSLPFSLASLSAASLSLKPDSSSCSLASRSASSASGLCSVAVAVAEDGDEVGVEVASVTLARESLGSCSVRLSAASMSSSAEVSSSPDVTSQAIEQDLHNIIFIFHQPDIIT
jgi:hypothetical protein